MKATVKKEDLQTAIKATNRVVGKPQKVFLLFNKDNTVSIVVNTISYFKYTIGAKVVKPGKLALQTSIFENLSLLRKNEIEFSKSGNMLNVFAGTKHKLYCSNVEKEDIAFPVFKKAQVVSIKSKGVGRFKKMIEAISFYPVDEVDYVPVQIVNTKKYFVCGLADSVHCIFCRSKKPMVNQDFSFMTNLKLLKDISTFLESNTQLSISDSAIIMDSPNIKASLPILQEGNDTIKNAETSLPDSNYKKGSIVFDSSKLAKWIDSISIICEGADLLKLTIKGTKVSFKLKTSFGGGEDIFKCTSNSIGNMKLDLPLIMFTNILDACSRGKTTTMQLSKNDNYYKLSAETQQFFIECVAPVASIS